MISENKLSKLARKHNIGFGIIEKDYFLTMLLEGISQNKKLKENWVFKGGTALRKVYFKEYRYSEDLDFTLLNDLSKKEIETELEKVFDFLKEKYNANYRIKSFHKKGFVDLKIQFDGLRGGKNTITLDLMSDEIIVTPSKEMKIMDEYNEEYFSLLVYSLEEILLEKLRSLLQRTRVRDYYDCWFLLKYKKEQLDLGNAKELFNKKANYKKVKLKTIEQFFEARKVQQAKAYYERQLREQISELPEFETMIQELQMEVKDLKLTNSSK
ncbi:MAG: nucleotidyl transferase AbiEii/AbiGii toxin family protein [Candidatus Diapherotrites archaeon]